MTQEVINTTINAGVAIVSMSRSAVRNAMDQRLIDGIKDEMLRLDADYSVKAIILRGQEYGFSAGSDLGFISRLSLPKMARFEQETGDMARIIGHIQTPVIASVENFAIGGGMILAVCCDIVVAGEGSRWSLPEVPHGWLTPWGIGALIERVGKVKARNLCFCIETLNGQQGHEMGLVDYVVPDGQVDERALQIAKHIAALPSGAVRATKRFFSNYIMRDAEIMDFEANRLFAENCRQPDALETLNKYKSKADLC